MSIDLDERWYEAVARELAAINAAVTQVDATHPRTRYPLARRLWWRVFGEPGSVRAARYRERRERADAVFAALHAHARRA